MRHVITLLLVLSLPALEPPLSGATLLVANKSDDTVDLIDLASGESVATLPTGHAPHEIAVSADGRTAVVSNYGDRDDPGASLTVIDIEAATVVRTIDLGGHTRPHGVQFLADDRLLATAEGSSHLLVVDVTAGAILRQVETGQRVSHMVSAPAGSDRAFVANIGSGTVTAIDLATGAKLADIETGDGAEGIAATPDGAEIWVGNRGADTLSIIDPESLEVVATIPCSGFPIRVAMTPSGTHALVSAARSGEIVLFDVAARRETARARLDLASAPDADQRLFGDRFGTSPVPVGIVIAHDGARAWVAATQADVVVAIDPETLAVLGALEAGREPDGMAWSPIAPASR